MSVNTSPDHEDNQNFKSRIPLTYTYMYIDSPKVGGRDASLDDKLEA